MTNIPVANTSVANNTVGIIVEACDLVNCILKKIQKDGRNSSQRPKICIQKTEFRSQEGRN